MRVNRRGDAAVSAASVHIHHIRPAAQLNRPGRQSCPATGWTARDDLLAPVLRCPRTISGPAISISSWYLHHITFFWKMKLISIHLDEGSSGNGCNRPSLMEIPYLPPGALFMARSDQTADYSRPPPPGSSASGGGGCGGGGGPSPLPGGSNSCFNCGASGHRGTQCQQTTFDEIINPSPA